MGIIGNFNVYGLMILPLAMVIRGKNISLSRLTLLIVFTVCLQFAESILRASVVGQSAASLALEAAVIPVIEICFFTHMLADSKSIKTFHLQDAVAGEDAVSVANPDKKDNDKGGDVAAAMAAVWCLSYVVFFRWGEWYRSLSSLGFEPANLVSGAEAFCQLLATLSSCRMILASGGSASVFALLVAARGAAVVAGAAMNPLVTTACVSVALYVAGPTIAGAVSGKAKKQ